jgi:hypothetical protein
MIIKYGKLYASPCSGLCLDDPYSYDDTILWGDSLLKQCHISLSLDFQLCIIKKILVLGGLL